MKILKSGGHRIFEKDDQTSAVVSRMLSELEKNGMDAVRKFSRELDQWDPPSFELSEKEIEVAKSMCDDQLRSDTRLPSKYYESSGVL